LVSALILFSLLAAAPSPPIDGKLHVYFLDVGHGDATLLVAPTGRSVLIDSGPAAALNHLRLRIPQIAKVPLDLVILTSAGEEHLGGMAEVLEGVGARRFLDPGLRDQGPAHTALLKALQEQGVQVVLPVPDPDAPGELLRIDMGGGVELQVLWPRAPVEALLSGPKKLEANSVVVRAVYKETSLLLMGDAQPETEEYLLKRRYPLQSTLLKVSEHGSAAGSTLPFLVAARPLAAIISVGPGNPLGAPARAALGRLQQVGVKVFRTDLDGEIAAISDGQRFSVSTERLPAGEATMPNWTFPLAPPAPVAAVVPKDRPGNVLHLEDVEVPAVVPSPSKKTKKQGREEPEIKRAAPSGDDGVIAVLVAKKGDKFFHYADCPAVKKLSPSQMVIFTSRGAAMKKFKPAADCQP
jgi:beta-lactamase superfamily II metal-dependent hydrolase